MLTEAKVVNSTMPAATNATKEEALSAADRAAPTMVVGALAMITAIFFSH